jgi:transcriptional regulator with XRE-family HTH domain
LTQARIGELLGFTQPHIQAFESGRRRISVTELPKLADLLGVSVEELLGRKSEPGQRGRPSLLEKQFQQASRLSKKQQQFVSKVLEAVLIQAQEAPNAP